MTLKQQRDAYKAFFIESEAGKIFVAQLKDQHDRNIRDAEKLNSLDYLSRGKGNSEALDLIEIVINTEAPKK